MLSPLPGVPGISVIIQEEGILPWEEMLSTLLRDPQFEFQAAGGISLRRGELSRPVAVACQWTNFQAGSFLLSEKLECGLCLRHFACGRRTGELH